MVGDPKVEAVDKQGHSQEIDWMGDGYVYVSGGELFLQVSGDGRLGAIVVAFETS